MKTYFVLYFDFQEETIEASSVRLTAKLISFYSGKTLVLAVPVSEIRRVGLSKAKLSGELDANDNGSVALKELRAMLESRQKSTNADEAHN